MRVFTRVVLPPWAPAVALTVTVVAFASGSSSIPEVTEVGRTARWVALFVLLAVALQYAAVRGRESLATSRGLLRFAAFPAAFAALALLSTAWSVDPWLTFRRACSLAILFLVAGALAWGSLGNRDAAKRLLGAIVAGAAIVALIGAVLLALPPGYAAQEQTLWTPWRYRGFGQNPNTVSLLAAVALPPAAWLLLDTKRTAARMLLAMTVLLLLLSILATQSRGALLAAVIGLGAVLVVVARSLAMKAASVGALVVLLVAGNAVRQLSTPPPPPYASRAPAPYAVPAEVANEPGGEEEEGAPQETATPVSGAEEARTERTGGLAWNPPPSAPPWTPRVVQRADPTFPLFAGPLPRREDEIGHPLLSTEAPSRVGSGRGEAWLRTVEQVRDRPVLGYGFGTEATVFADRLYYFQGGNPENAYLGILLQLGGVGFLLFLALAGAIIARTPRALRAAGTSRGLVGASLGVFLAGGAVMLIQSYVYSVGNIATVSVWVATFVLAGEVFSVARAAEPQVQPTERSWEVTRVSPSA